MTKSTSSGGWQEFTAIRASYEHSSPHRYTNYSSISQDDIISPGHAHHEWDSASNQRKSSFFQTSYQTCLQFYLQHELYISTSLLILSTAGERVTFKFMIDRMFPFKFVLIEIIFLLSFLLFSIVTLYKIHKTKEITSQMRKFPHSQILVMAGLDSLQFLGLVCSGVAVSPTMTVILMHASTIFVVGGSRIAFPHRNYGDSHKFGLFFISGALVIGLAKILWCDWSSDCSFYSTRSALMYIAASALQGLSTLYKENSLVAWGQPVDIYYLTSFLFFYQFWITVAFSLIFYLITDLFIANVSISSTIYYGWRCFLGITPNKTDLTDDIPTCDNSLYIIIGYVLSTFFAILSINSVLQIGNQIVGRAVAGSVLAAFVVLWFYDYVTSNGMNHSVILSCHVSVFDILAIIVLLIGLEVYGRDPEPDVEIITNYPSSPTAIQGGGSEPVTPT